LIDQSVGGAELPNRMVPALLGVAPVLDETGLDPRLTAEGLELFEGDIADAEQARAAALLDRLHRPPGFPVGRRQAGPLSWSVKQVGIDRPGAQVFERAGEGLLDLDRDGSPRVIGQTVILPPREGELRLEEKVVTGEQAGPERRRDRLTDRGLDVV